MEYVGEKAKKKYAFWFAISFPLLSYATGIEGIALGTVVHIFYALCTMFFIFKEKIKIGGNGGVYLPPLLFSFFFTIITLFDIEIFQISNFSFLNVFKELGKVYLWSFCSSVVSYVYFENKAIGKWLIRIGFISTVFLFLQFIVWLVGSAPVNGIVSFGPLQPYHVDYIASISSSFGTSYYRPSSFFSEPAFYSNFILCCIVCVMMNFNEMSKIRKICYIVFFSAGIIVSTSTAGILLLLILFFIRYKDYIVKKWLRLLLGVLAVGILLCGVYLNLDTLDEGTYIGNAVTYVTSKVENMDQSARFGKSFDKLKYLSKEQMVIGTGFGSYLTIIPSKDELYINSFTILIFSVGIVGLLCFVSYLVCLLFKWHNSMASFLVLAYLVESANGAVAFTVYGILILGLAIFIEKYSNSTVKR